MELTLIAVIVVLLALLCVSTALSWGVRYIGRVIARGRAMRPQTRYFMA